MHHAREPVKVPSIGNTLVPSYVICITQLTKKKKKTGEWRRIVQAKSCFSQVRALDPETLTYEEHAANPPISTSFDEFLLHYIRFVLNCLFLSPYLMILADNVE